MRFEPVKIEDKAEFDALLSQRRYENSWLTFGNLFTWRHAFGTEWARLPEGILIRFGQEDEVLFLPPLVTAASSFAAVVGRLAAAMSAAGKKFRLLGLSEAMAAEVEGAFPGKFAAEIKRDRFDYLYNAEDLRSLAGRRYHAKRNYVNRFRLENADWQYEPLSATLARECLQVAETWYGGRDYASDSDLAHEYDAIIESFRHFDELGYLGGAIRVDGKVQAFTIGELMNADTVVVHIEKADPGITGLYPMINQEFCRRLGAAIAYVNREEDMGDAGLRKAKESYYPVQLVEKYELMLRQ